MTLQQRIQQSAAELGKLLRQAEKQHRRFLKRRDARMHALYPCTPEGHHLQVIPDHVPIHIFHRGEYSHTASNKYHLPQSPIEVKVDSRVCALAVQRALEAHGIEHEIPFDNGKAFAIDNKTAALAHARYGAIARQINSIVEQIDSKLNAVLEIYGTKAFLDNPASKVVFNVEIRRIGDKFSSQVQYVIKAD